MQDVSPPGTVQPPTGKAAIRYAALFAAVSLISFFFVVWGVRSAIHDMTIARTWELTEATIVEIDAPRRGRGGPYIPVRLRVDDHQGDWLMRWADRELTLPWRWSWSEPRRFPAIGNRIAVYVAPAPPFRIMPASALSRELWAAFGLVVLFLPGGGFFLWGAVMAWRGARR